MDKEGKNQEAGNQQPIKKGIADAVEQFKEQNMSEEPENVAKGVSIPTAGKYNPQDYQAAMQKETDPDLTTSYEIIKLPSEGKFYDNKLSEVEVEYMTSKDEDLITTPSLIESGIVLDVLLKRKIKTKGIDPSQLLPGDRNAILLFLRTSSYGAEYNVQVNDPRTGIPFDATVNLLELEYKVPEKLPDPNGHFTVELPMRKKSVKFRLLTVGEDSTLFDKAEEIKDAFGHEFSEYNTMKLKASVVSIEGNTDRSYIDRFIDAMPALDALTIRREILNVSPDVDMAYTFTAKDGFKFPGILTVGVDFFFPVS
jgi:hypothetical protein